MANSQFDFLNSILYNKKDLLKDEPERIKDYIPWLINTGLSYHLDTIIAANFLNTYSDLPKNVQYSYGLSTIRPKKRKFTRWSKKINNNDLDLVCQAYKCNKRVAEQYLEILTDEQKQLLKQQQELGGV